MAQAQKLKTFEIKPIGDGEGATLHLAAADGTEMTVEATREQLDLVAEELDAMLDATEEMDAV